MRGQPYSQEFRELFCHTRDKLHYLDNLDEILQFPPFISNSLRSSYPAASAFYLNETVVEPCNNEEPYIIRVAYRACSIYNNGAEIFSNYLLDFAPFGNDRELPALGSANEIIKKYPLEVRAMVYDLISLLSHGKPISQLWADLEEGGTEALFKLVRIDKSALTTPRIGQLIRQYQFEGNWAFFEELAKAVKDHPISSRDYRPIEVILTARFWREEFHKWTREDLYRFLEETDVLPRSSGGHESFRLTINSLGLKKARGRPKKVE